MYSKFYMYEYINIILTPYTSLYPRYSIYDVRIGRVELYCKLYTVCTVSFVIELCAELNVRV